MNEKLLMIKALRLQKALDWYRTNENGKHQIKLKFIPCSANFWAIIFY